MSKGFGVTKNVPRLIGSGGGGKKIAADSLQSHSRARILELLSQGPIVGLVDGDKSIYLNGTRLRSLDGRLNFEKGFSYDERKGTLDQTAMLGYADEVTSELTVQVDVKKDAGPVVKTTLSSDLDAVKILLTWPSFQVSKGNGSVTRTSVQYKIYVRATSGGFIERVNRTLSGKQSGQYQEQWYIPLHGTGPWDIKIERLTADPALPGTGSDTVYNAFQLTSITEVIEEKLRHPNCALIGSYYDAQYFQSLPSRAFDVKGLIVQIPNNAAARDDGSLVYFGPWDGGLRLAWTANPLWILYDLLTNKNYGIGLNPPQIDKASFYTAGQYCDELIPNGRGGTEPRYVCNTYIQDVNQAREVIQAFCSVFHGHCYWIGGKIVVSIQSPKSYGHTFTNADVKGSYFRYSKTPKLARKTVAIVSFTNTDDRYQQDYVQVINRDGVRKWGQQVTNLKAFACLSRSMAVRLGRAALFADAYQTNMVTFTPTTIGGFLSPGEIIRIQDRRQGLAKDGGLVIESTIDEIWLDSAITLPSNARLVCNTQSGSEERNVTTTPGGGITSLRVDIPFSEPPSPHSNWILFTDDDVVEMLFEIVNIRELNDHEYEVTALNYREDKWSYIESNLDFIVDDVTPTVQSGVSAPKTITISSFVSTTASGNPSLIAAVEWTEPLLSSGKKDPNVSSYEVQIREISDNWGTIQQVTNRRIEYQVDASFYTARVRSLNMFGDRSSWVETPITPISDTFIQQLDSADPDPLATKDFRSWDGSTAQTPLYHILG